MINDKMGYCISKYNKFAYDTREHNDIIIDNEFDVNTIFVKKEYRDLDDMTVIKFKEETSQSITERSVVSRGVSCLMIACYFGNVSCAMMLLKKISILTLLIQT